MMQFLKMKSAIEEIIYYIYLYFSLFYSYKDRPRNGFNLIFKSILQMVRINEIPLSPPCGFVLIGHLLIRSLGCFIVLM